MKVLHILSTNQYSGAENVVCQIIGMFSDKSNVEMAYCSLDGPIRKKLQEMNIVFIPIKKVSFIEIRNVIKKYKPDIIHAHDIRASLMASFFLSDNIKIISQIHGTFDALTKFSYKSLLYYFAATRCSNIFFVSRESFESFVFKHQFRDKSSLLLNVIDIRFPYVNALADNKTYNYDVVFLGRLSYVKNPQRIIKIMSKVVNINPKITLAIIGRGELADNLKEQINKEGLDKNVSLLGFMHNPYKVLQSCKVMLLASRTEGTPMCSLEAMALGIPIISTPTDGLREVVQDGVTGYLSEDDNILAEKVAILCTDSELRQRLSTASLEKSYQINDLTSYKEKLIQAYKD